MRTIKDSDTRKQEILSGALKVFSEKGYDKTTISDIAKELGISQGLCYRYYSSKEEIYEAALTEYAEYIVQANLKRYTHSGKSLKERIRALSGGMREYRNPEKDNDLLYSLFHGENSQKMHDQLMMKIAQMLVPHIKEALNAAKDSGEISLSDTDTFAYFYVYGQVGMLLNEGNKKDCDKRIGECLIEMLNL